MQTEYLQEVMRGILAMCDGYQIGLQIHSLHASGSRLGAHEVADSSDAVIVLGNLAETHISQLLRQRIPLAIVDYLTASQPAHHLVCDNAKGVEVILDHLMSLGHRRITYVSTRTNESNQRDPDQGERQAAYVESMKARRLTAEVFPFYGPSRNPLEELLARAAGTDHPTAWLCSDTDTVGTIWAGLTRAGYHVPQDFALAVVASAASIHEIATGMLTACTFPFEEMGKEAVSLLRGYCQSPQQTKRIIDRFEPTLHIGCSTVSDLQNRPRWPEVR
jgi:DNA-binding LacI/PurR family transcriptional regulator